MAFENRLLLYADILGWKRLLRAGDYEKATAAMECVHTYAQDHNERFRQELMERHGKPADWGDGVKRTYQANPVFLAVQFGAFSDHFVFSMPDDFGSRILDAASWAIRQLMRMGFLTRGAVVTGPLSHVDNMVFGPALVEAVCIEERAEFPRIVVTEAAIQRIFEEPDDPGYRPMIRDQFGQIVVNPFALPFETADQEALVAFARNNFFLSEIEDVIELQLTTLTGAGDARAAGKWCYLRDFISGPVFSNQPVLRQCWRTRCAV